MGDTGRCQLTKNIGTIIEPGVTRALIFVVAAGAAIVAAAPSAQALPSYARQTGQACGACHTDFPALTPFGRRFKLGGYTLGGGDYRSTLFPAFQDAKIDPLAAYAKKVEANADKAANKDKPDSGDSKIWFPPLSAMAIVGFTHTQVAQDPTGSSYSPNDNTVVSPVSFFFGGAITEHIGAFVQGTYSAAGMGTPHPFDHTWALDNTDIRYANTTMLGDMSVTYGITANNNPSVQDVWNTTPAWGFPYAESNLAPTPGAATLIDGTFAAHVGGVGVYAFINDMIYLELTGYRTLGFNAQNKLGENPMGAPGLFDGVAPYWRIAFEPHWGNHWLEIGAFGMFARVRPWQDASGLTVTDTFGETDKFTDTGFDAQYQYQGEHYWFTLRGSYIREEQKLDASFLNGLSANQANQLNTLKAQASLTYGDDNKIVLTGQYFKTQGSDDIILYGGNASGFSPDSNGWIAEIAYVPFGLSKSPLWPWWNARLALQYIYYNKFDGDTVHAHDNNTLFLHAWVAM